MARPVQMRCIEKRGSYTAGGIRWAARAVGGLLAALVLSIVFCHAFSPEGLPNPFTQPAGVAFELLGLAITWVGLIVAWKLEGVGGVMIIAGQLAFHIIERRLWLSTMGEFFDLAGILFLLSWWLSVKSVQTSCEARE
ncbi:MAG TPA: hypothetical protein VMW16_13405 [Sedimentisphaerales bacterium]|nr:hypothetical protein [Sedimentisphaerales bacterium]